MWKGYLEQTDLLELIKFEKEDRLEWISSQESVWHFSITNEVKLHAEPNIT